MLAGKEKIVDLVLYIFHAVDILTYIFIPIKCTIIALNSFYCSTVYPPTCFYYSWPSSVRT